MKEKLFRLMILLALVFQREACIGGEADAGQAGIFLRYGVGSRPLSMGRAFVGVADDANAILWNPAASLHLDIWNFTFSQYSPYGTQEKELNDPNMLFLGISRGTNIVIPFIARRVMQVSGGFLYFDNGEIDCRDELNRPVNSPSSSNEWSSFVNVTTSVAGVLVAPNLKYIHRNNFGNTQGGFGFDASLFTNLNGLLEKFRFPKIVRINVGTNAQNIVNNCDFPRIVRIGGSLAFAFETISFLQMVDPILKSLIIANDLEFVEERSVQTFWGAEFKSQSIKGVSAGLQTGYNAADGFTAGLSISWEWAEKDSRLSLDLSPFREGNEFLGRNDWSGCSLTLNKNLFDPNREYDRTTYGTTK